MVTNRVILALIFLFGYGFAQSTTAQNSGSLQAEATVEIQYDGEVGSGIILMTSSASCVASVTPSSIISSPSTATSSAGTSANQALIVSGPSTTAIWTSPTPTTPFNTPPVFGTTRTQMINATSAGQPLFPMATGSSQMITATSITQSQSESSTPTPNTSLVVGLGIRPDITWSHVFFWAAITEIVLGFL